MKTAALVFPHQLFAAHPALKYSVDFIVLTEDPLFFGDAQYPCHFHRQKLVLHRASMKHYQAALQSQGFAVQYADYATTDSEPNRLWANLKLQGVSELHCAQVVDFTLEKRLKRLSAQHQIKIHWHQTPGFINSEQQNRDYRAKKKRWFMADFYRWQRQRLGILVDEDCQPIGGQWSFDQDNRHKLPKNKITDLPSLNFPAESPVVKAAKTYVAQNFPHAVGSVERFYYPVDHFSAEKWLEDFLATRFKDFGVYEDAIVEDQNWLYHSVLTPLLNIGLLTPQQVISAAQISAEKYEIPLNSLEGFIRQIIGWREFMRATYEDLGVTMRTTNHWQHHRNIPASFYHGTTGILPIDNTIKRVLETGYCHHIERLMILGGFLFLCEVDPDQIYTWFMELFVDSYDWVMVPNVYAMSQNADGGLITTKPYFSGSNYVRKMSHYPSGDWSEVWDSLYWRWIVKHADSLRGHPRWSMMVRIAYKMEPTKKEQYLARANCFLDSIT